jgi:hypothetical protein
MNLVDRLILPVMRKQGPLTNKEIYTLVRHHARQHQYRLTPNWRATVRNTLQRHAKGHPKCGDRPLFIHLERNLWKVRH